MKKSLSIAALALALCAGQALAADLPAVKAPLPPPPPPPPLWTGLYVGLNAGYSFGSSNTVDVTSATLYNSFGTIAGGVVGFDPLFGTEALAGTGTTNVNRSGFLGGGQVGYNYQFNSNFLVGFEADLQGAAIRGESGFVNGGAWTNTFALPGVGPGTITALNRLAVGSTVVTARTDWLGTARARLGYLWNPSLLLYVTGGLAYGGAKATTTQSFAGLAAGLGAGVLATPFSASFGSLGGYRRYDDTRVGWTVGAGLEWLLSPNLSFKAEYLYYDLGTARYVNDPVVATGATTSTFGTLNGIGVASLNSGVTRVKFDGHIARIGINYHFVSAPVVPVVARY